MNSFQYTLAAHGKELVRSSPRVLQLNVGKLCNLTCVHCHVSAGPRRKEIITSDTVDKILDWFLSNDIPVLDLTGGAPEMIPDFRRIVETVHKEAPDRTIIDRCNLTILVEPGYEWLTEFLAEYKVEVVASMPCYEPKNVEEQRGHGVFDKSIEGLKLLNSIGYGVNTDLNLNLVYNPNGAFLPPDQVELQADYKEAMWESFQIQFNDLYVLTNLPVARFASYLKRKGELADYMQLLKDNFNASTIEGLMCRDTINVSWQGEVFDCDFNQMMKMPIKNSAGESVYLWDLDVSSLEGQAIATANHCFGCTAGCGSSCGGSLTEAVAV